MEQPTKTVLPSTDTWLLFAAGLLVNALVAFAVVPWWASFVGLTLVLLGAGIYLRARNASR